MNIALPAFALIILALPGFIFIYSYNGRLRSQNDPVVSSGSMTMGWVVALIIAAAAHAIWIPIVDAILLFSGTGIQADMGAVLYLLAGEYKDSKAFEVFARSCTAHPYNVFFYFSTLYFSAGLIGLGLNKFVLRTQLDLRVGFLKFNNKWHYLFYGDEPPRVDAVWVTVTCCHKSETCLYAGLLKTYEFSPEGEIERLTLQYAQRAQFRRPTDVPKFEPIPGDKFVIWCRDVNTLNLQYIVVTKSTDDSNPRQH